MQDGAPIVGPDTTLADVDRVVDWAGCALVGDVDTSRLPIDAPLLVAIPALPIAEISHDLEAPLRGHQLVERVGVNLLLPVWHDVVVHLVVAQRPVQEVAVFELAQVICRRWHISRNLQHCCLLELALEDLSDGLRVANRQWVGQVPACRELR